MYYKSIYYGAYSITYYCSIKKLNSGDIYYWVIGRPVLPTICSINFLSK